MVILCDFCFRFPGRRFLEIANISVVIKKHSMIVRFSINYYGMVIRLQNLELYTLLRKASNPCIWKIKDRLAFLTYETEFVLFSAVLENKYLLWGGGGGGGGV